MTHMFQAVRGVSWAEQVPIVCDRAMGKTATIRKMVETGLRFVTALTRTEFDAYAPALPHESFATLDPQRADDFDADVKLAAGRALEAGLTRHSDNLFAVDLGLVERADISECVPIAPVGDFNAEAMRLARKIDESVDQGRFASFAAAARSLGLKKALAAKYRVLRKLSEQQQREVLAGNFAAHSLASLLAVSVIEDVDERAAAFEALRAHTPAFGNGGSVRRRLKKSSKPGPTQNPIRVRVVAYFNPEGFVEQRHAAKRQIAAVDAFVAELRAKIAARPGRYPAQQIHGLIDRELRSRSLLDVFDVRLSDKLRLDVTLDRTAWAARRRYDGFTVLLAHPDLTASAVELCRLYRAKDAVEKDFKIIKSVVQLRPVWHHTDAKVRAHVTICMLALLLERRLRQRLVGHALTERIALEVLRDCRLNHYAATGGPGLYAITTLDAEQRDILKTLRLLHLADDDDLAAKIQPR